MTTSLILSKLGLSKDAVNYSEKANAFLSTGYTSMAGNTYYNAVRLAEGIVIKEDIGDGYLHTFLNGIKLFSIHDKELIAEKSFSNNIRSDFNVKREVINMLMEFLKDAAESNDWQLDTTQAKKQIEKIINDGFSTNQIEMIKNQSGKFLKG